MEKVNKMYEWFDFKTGAKKRETACHNEKDMLFECIFNSSCYKNCNNFKYCMQEGIDKDCRALRYDLFLCKRSQIFWQRSMREDSR